MRWFIFCTFILSLTFTLIGLAVDVVFHTSYVPAIEKWQEQKNNQLTHYLQEKLYFENHNIFSSKHKTYEPSKDFADFLHSRIAQNKDYLFIDQKQQAQVLALRKKWLEKKFLLSPPQAIVEIFNRALDYEYWNIEKTLGTKANLSAREFIVAGQLLLINSLKEKHIDPMQTLKKVRHFSKLLLSCENLNFKLAGLSLLSKEPEFINFINQRYLAQKPQWNLISTGDLKRYRNFLYMTYDYYDFLIPSSMLNKIFIQEKLPSGFCSIFRKKDPFLSKVAPLLKDFFPFEPGFYAEYNTYLEIKKRVRKICLTPPPSSAAPLPKYASKIPFFRRIKALKLLLKNKSLSEGV